MKRLFDIIFSFVGLLLLSPLLLIIAVMVKSDSDGPVFFKQKRVGKNFRDFEIYKFRSMSELKGPGGPLVTVSGDSRITKVGQILRKYKLDELPQLINVLIGDMSFVGPRPEVRKYVEIFRGDYENLLSVRPGITDPASIFYSEEEKVLAESQNWEETYIKDVLPDKIRYSLIYVNHKYSIFTDLRLIFKTIFKIQS